MTAVGSISVLAWAASAVVPLQAQTAEQFLEDARAGTERYRDPTAAIRDGYRRVGLDFPAMGEHWINPGLLVAGRLDAGRPQILSYASIDGRLDLVGVAYGLPLVEGEAPPEYPADRDAWHEHNGTIDDESFLDHGEGSHEAGDAGVRVAFLHAWIWLENPAGPFATDNWALPFARLGLDPPAHIPPDGARALSLVAGNEAYYRAALEKTLGPDRGARLSDEWLSATGRTVRERLDAVPASTRLDSEDLRWLAGVWDEMCAGIRDAVEARMWSRVEPVFLGSRSPDAAHSH